MRFRNHCLFRLWLAVAWGVAFQALAPVNGAGQPKPVLILRGETLALNTPLFCRALEEGGFYVQRPRKQVELDKLEEFALVVFDGESPKSRGQDADGAKKIWSYVEHGGIVWFFASARPVLNRAAKGGELLKVEAIKGDKKGSSDAPVALPQHPWLKGIAISDLPAAAPGGLRIEGGDKVLSGADGRDLLLWRPISKGGLIYFSYDIFRAEEHERDDLLRLITNILTGLPLQSLEDHWRSEIPRARHGSTGPDEIYVDVKKGRDGAKGSRDRPLRSIPEALGRLGPGDTLWVGGGVYPLCDFLLLQGEPDHPVTIRAVPGEPVILDGGLPEFRETAKMAWEKVADGHPDEWRSVKSYEDTGWPTKGDHMHGLLHAPETRLLCYEALEDLRAENESFARIHDTLDPRPGPADDKGKARESEFRWPWTYYGPGLWRDALSGRIHIRLSPTHWGVPGVRDWDGPTDPRQLAMSISFPSTGVTVGACRHVVFRDLTLRGGGDLLLRLRGSNEQLTFDHIRFLGSAVSAHIANASHVRFLHCVFDGGCPSWTSRHEVKEGRYYTDGDGKRGYMGSVSPTLSRVIRINDSVEDLEIAYCELRRGHDAAYLYGHGTRFHHNLVEDFHDEALFLGGAGDDVRVYQNVIRNVLQAFSFAEYRSGKVGGMKYLYRNLVDLRVPVRTHRYQPQDGSPFAWGADFKMNHPIDPFFCYQNTFVVARPRGVASFIWSNTDKEPHHPRGFLNNIHVSLDSIFPFAEVPPPEFPGSARGNCWWRYGSATPFTAFSHRAKNVDGPYGDLEALWRSKTAAAHGQRTGYGWEGNSLIADPRFQRFSGGCDFPMMFPNDDLRLGVESPARGAGAPLPADLEDPLRPEGAARPDLGFLPYGSEPLRVGVDGRHVFPDLEAPIAMAGPDQKVMAAPGQTEAVLRLDASASRAQQGRITSWSWSASGRALATGEKAEARLGPGWHWIVLEVLDDKGRSGRDALLVHVSAAGDAGELLQDGGFEDTATFAAAGDDGSIRGGQVLACVGYGSSRGVLLGGKSTERYRWVRQKFPVTPGTRLKIACRVRPAGGGGTVVLLARAHQGGQNKEFALAEIPGVAGQETRQDYRMAQGELTVPDWATTLELSLELTGPEGAEFHADDFSARAIPAEAVTP